MDCPACSALGLVGVPGVAEIEFRTDRLTRFLRGRVEPLRPHSGPYAGTGLRLSPAEPESAVFCARHAPDARRLAAERLTLRAALRRLTKSDRGAP